MKYLAGVFFQNKKKMTPTETLTATKITTALLTVTNLHFPYLNISFKTVQTSTNRFFLKIP